MRTFSEYAQQREKLEAIFESIIIEAQNNPEFAQLLDEAGFWGNLWNAAKQFGQGIWSGGGIKPGAQSAWSQMTGPQTQFQNALAALTKAKQAIENDPNWKQSTTTSGKGNLAQWLGHTIQELGLQVKQFQNQGLPQQGASTQVAGKGGYAPPTP